MLLRAVETWREEEENAKEAMKKRTQFVATAGPE
jgi:hypothetical protein